MVPPAAAQMFFAPRARHVVARFGVRATCVFALVLDAVTFAGFVLLGRATPLWVIEVLFALLGIAFAHIMPPATVTIMSSLPREKAGAGSAVNNVFRQSGGAPGTAVLGSLLSVVYRHGVQGAFSVLTPPQRATAVHSIESTLGVVQALGAKGTALIQPADIAFIHAMHITAFAAAGVAVLGAVVAMLTMPGKTRPAAVGAGPENTGTAEGKAPEPQQERAGQ
jgi:hypothetical protein